MYSTLIDINLNYIYYTTPNKMEKTNSIEEANDDDDFKDCEDSAEDQ